MISNNNNMLSYVIRREERLALKERSFTADKECSWFEPTMKQLCVLRNGTPLKVHLPVPYNVIRKKHPTFCSIKPYYYFIITWYCHCHYFYY